jgi:uncharacterized spore protein YtfJ
VNRNRVTAIAGALTLGFLASGQNPPEKKPPAPAVQAASEFANGLARRLSNDLHTKTVVGEPIKVGSLTLIPIVMIDVSFGGAAIVAPGSPAAAASQNPRAGGDAFLMSGEVRPLGFVVIGKKGTRFISVAKTPAK